MATLGIANVPPLLNEYGAELENLQRQEEYAKLLRAQSMRPLQSAGMAGRTVAPISWAQGAAQLLNSGAAGMGEKQVLEGRKDLGKRYTSDLAKVLAQGTPEALMMHPATQGIGSQLMLGNMYAQQLRGALGGGAPGGETPPGMSPSTSQHMFGTPEFATPQQGAQPQGLPGVSPQAFALSMLPMNPMAGPMAKLAQEGYTNATKPHAVAEGGSLVRPTGEQIYARPKLGEGIQPTGTGPRGEIQGVQPIPGYTDSQAQIINAQERAKGQYATTDIPAGDGSTRPVLRSDLPQVLGQQGQQSAAPQPQGGMPSYTERQAEQIARARHNAGDNFTMKSGVDYNQVREQSQGGPPRTPTTFEKAFDERAGRERGEQQANKENAEKAAKSILEMSNNTLRTLNNLMENKAGVSGITGPYFGALPSIRKESTNAEADLRALKNQLSVQAIQQMRDASKTGGAVGQVTEREWDRLAYQVAGLWERQGTEQFNQRLQEIQATLLNMQNISRKAYEDVYGPLNWKPTGPVPKSQNLSGSEQEELQRLRKQFGRRSSDGG